MQPGLLQPYEESLLTAEPVAVCTPDGDVIDLDIGRWLAPADSVDETVLAHCTGPVLDVGCGPGRFIAALVCRGTPTLGLDIAEMAVALGRSRGLPTLHRSVFSRIPGEGQWATALLMDGNIGIGGDARRLLTRIRELLRPDGALLVETDPDDRVDTSQAVRFYRHGCAIGPPFAWARLGLQPLLMDAPDLGYRIGETWTADGRTFTQLH